MSQIIYSTPDKEDRYIGANVGNTALQHGATFASQQYRKIQYGNKIGLNKQFVNVRDYNFQSANRQVDDSDLLSLGGSSDQRCAPTDRIFNEIKLSTNDGTEIRFIDAVCNVTQSATVNKQAVAGRSGTVKEYIQADDYSIVISGNLIIDSQYAFPVDLLRSLINILSVADTIKVESVLLNDIYEITKVAFVKCNYDQTACQYVNSMPFTIEFISDKDYDFEVN